MTAATWTCDMLALVVWLYVIGFVICFEPVRRTMPSNPNIDPNEDNLISGLTTILICTFWFYFVPVKILTKALSSKR